MPIDCLTDLPLHLTDRLRIARDGKNANGQFVLYWLRTAMRAIENPALDAAIMVAKKLCLPVLVYQGLSQHYAYASDRHHTFMLEGARDVQHELAKRGISYAFHLATRDDASPHLVSLARRSAVVVTEEMPVDPPRRFLKSLSHKVDTPIVCVDTACVVPMQLVDQPHTRAFEYRDATKALYEERIALTWPKLNECPRTFDIQSLPFASIDLQNCVLPELVAKCDIDHSIGPVVDTRGGSAEGYSRWNRFKENGLSQYAADRNNALIEGVSRMSAYLHYGMVSPMKLARETDAAGNAGGKKYLDELLIWREMAYVFCSHRYDHDQWSAIPDWAQSTLQTHVRDRRAHTYSWEELARAETDDAFWNAAQQSLLMQGELHNNVRMTWGKAILNWTKTPQDALKIMIDLNHRYALDGRDPASYGGLLWCLGQFDRPFKPESDISGTVRPRTTSDHARRLNTEAYGARVAKPRFDPIPRVAVIGAGISGLFAARTLADHGMPVKVFDKGRGVGGRMSARRVDGETLFDHGAQYFTARDARFQRYVQSWLEQGVVARWPDAQSNPSHKIVILKNGITTEHPDSNERFVGTPSMNAVCKHLATNLDVQIATRVDQIDKTDKGLRLTDDSGSSLGIFDCAIVSAPAAQTADLLANFPSIAQPISKIQMQPCWAVMASFEQPVTNDWVGAFIHGSFLTWAARNSSKPMRPLTAEHLVLHADHKWTTNNWERDAGEVAHDLLAEFWQASGSDARTPTHLQAHRWKFAIPIDPPETRCFFDADAIIVAGGDWAGGPRVEGAFLSGMAAAGRILGSLRT